MNPAKPANASLAAYAAATLGALLVVLVIVKALQYYTRPEPVSAARAAERKKALVELRNSSAQILSSYDWQDKPKGIVRLPIERAMALTVQEWANPTVARAKLAERVDKATALPPKPPEKPSQYE